MQSAASIDLEHDQLETVKDICQRLTGKRPSPATLHRWLRGRVSLEAVYVMGHWQTTPAAFARFIQAKTASMLPAAEDENSVRDEVMTRRLKKARLIASK